MEKIEVALRWLVPDEAAQEDQADARRLPGYATALAAGMDVGAAIPAPLVLAPGEIRLVPCGFAVAIPPGYEIQVRPRSGLAIKHGITVVNAPGTIDADYRGEVKVGLINLGQAAFTIEPGDRIAQLILAPVARAEFVVLTSLAPTERGQGGFGHTGIQATDPPAIDPERR